MLADGRRAVNGKCVLICTFVEKLWNALLSTTCGISFPQGVAPVNSMEDKELMQAPRRRWKWNPECTLIGVLVRKYSQFECGHVAGGQSECHDLHRTASLSSPSLADPLVHPGAGCKRCGVRRSLQDAGHQRNGRVLQLTIPAPSPTPSSSLPPETPPIQARVCQQKSAGELHLVGVEFLKALE